MKVVLQRVKSASVTIDNNVYSKIGTGMLLLFCVEKGDTENCLEWLANKILNLRFFEDDQGRMNKSIRDIGGEILIVSQFTLAADCKKGTRPGFDNAESPVIAKTMYEKFVNVVKSSNLVVQTGVFAADMQVSLVNDGPVTFILQK